MKARKIKIFNSIFNSKVTKQSNKSNIYFNDNCAVGLQVFCEYLSNAALVYFEQKIGVVHCIHKCFYVGSLFDHHGLYFSHQLNIHFYKLQYIDLCGQLSCTAYNINIFSIVFKYLSRNVPWDLSLRLPREWIENRRFMNFLWGLSELVEVEHFLICIANWSAVDLFTS